MSLSYNPPGSDIAIGHDVAIHKWETNQSLFPTQVRCTYIYAKKFRDPENYGKFPDIPIAGDRRQGSIHRSWRESPASSTSLARRSRILLTRF